ncbi:MAG TPA: hypothetical protein VIL36_23825 [Acidimicrobiales bacterium]
MEDGDRPAPAPPARGRRVGARALLVLGCLVLLVANLTVWLRYTALDTDRFVPALAPLARDPELTDALAAELTGRIFAEVDVEARVAAALPDDDPLIVATVTRLARGLVTDALRDALRSDAFATVWERALRETHRRALAVVDGDATDIALELTAVLDRADRTLEDLGVDLVDRRTIERIDDVVVARAEDVDTAGRVVELLRTLAWALPLAAVVLLGVALLVAADRRHTAGLLGAGVAVTMVVTFVALRITRRVLVDRIEGDVARRAAGEVWAGALAPLFRQTAVLLVLGLVVALGAWFLGPAAASLRAWGRDRARGPSPVVARLAGHRRRLQVGVLVAGAAVLLFLPSLSLTTAVVVVALAGLLVVLVDVVVPSPGVTA